MGAYLKRQTSRCSAKLHIPVFLHVANGKNLTKTQPLAANELTTKYIFTEHFKPVKPE